MESSAAKLRTRVIDLMQVHNLVDVATHLRTLREWKEQGRVRYIGVTHYTSSAYANVERVLRSEPVDFLQINYSLAEPDAAERLLPLAHERGIAVIANRPFAEGGLFRRLAKRPLPDWAAGIGCTSWAQFFLKWIIADERITCVIPATAKVRNLETNMRAGEGPLPDTKMRQRMADIIK
jgi:diketogulonate reductase-like aldo/keto reductase